MNKYRRKKLLRKVNTSLKLRSSLSMQEKLGRLIYRLRMLISWMMPGLLFIVATLNPPPGLARFSPSRR